jgi:hypothetical protein
MTAAASSAPDLDIFQHDGAAMMRFVLRGELAGLPVQYLEHSWDTAASTLGARELVVDVSGLAAADAQGLELLSRMRESGARLTAAQPPASPELLRSLAIPVAAPGRNRSGEGLFRWMVAPFRKYFTRLRNR